MSTRYEGAGAERVSFTVVHAGEEIGDDVVPEGQIALCFNYDEVFYIQGTPNQIIMALSKAQNVLTQNITFRPGDNYERPTE